MEGREFVMRASTVEYHAPARFDDLLEIFVRLARIGRTSATFDCAAYLLDGDTLMVTASQTMVLSTSRSGGRPRSPRTTARGCAPSRAQISTHDSPRAR